jgi:hypothetical protein
LVGNFGGNRVVNCSGIDYIACQENPLRKLLAT